MENYNAMIVVTCDIDQDRDEDLVLSGAFTTSSLGSWMENTGVVTNPWIPQPLPAAADTPIRVVISVRRGRRKCSSPGRLHPVTCGWPMSTRMAWWM